MQVESTPYIPLYLDSVPGCRKKNSAEPGFGRSEKKIQNRRAWFLGGRKFYFFRCFELGNFILFRGDLVLRKSSPHVFVEGGRRVAPSPIKVVLRCKRTFSAFQNTKKFEDPTTTAREIHILVRSAEISPKYHQISLLLEKKISAENFFPPSLVLGARRNIFFAEPGPTEKKFREPGTEFKSGVDST